MTRLVGLRGRMGAPEDGAGGRTRGADGGMVIHHPGDATSSGRCGWSSNQHALLSPHWMLLASLPVCGAGMVTFSSWMRK